MAFHVDDSDDMPVPDCDPVDYSAVNPQVPFVGGRTGRGPPKKSKRKGRHGANHRP